MAVDGLADFEVRERLLRHVEIDQDRIERLQRDDGRARVQVLTEIDLANAEPSGERCLDDLLLDQRLLRRHLRAGRFQRRRIGVESRLADGLRRELFLIALVVLLGEFRGRLQLLQFGEVVVGLQPQQQLAGRHLVAGVELDFVDHAGRLRREIGAAHGAQRSRPPGLATATWWRTRSTVDTVCGALAAPAMYFLLIEPMNACQPKTPPSTTATTRSMMTIGLIMDLNLTGLPSSANTGCMVLQRSLR